MSDPRGLGVYLTLGQSLAGPLEAERRAERMTRASIKHVALCVEAVDRRAVDTEAEASKLEATADTYAEAGLTVHFYALPGEQRAALGAVVGAELGALARRVSSCRGVILDAEEAYRKRGPQLRDALAALVDGITERHAFGITTYGRPSGDGSYPWSEIVGRGWFGWQCYETAGSRVPVRRGLTELRAHWSHVVPHLAAYQRKRGVPGEPLDGAARLQGDLARCALDDAGEVDVPGIWIWADASLDAHERAILRDFAARAGW